MEKDACPAEKISSLRRQFIKEFEHMKKMKKRPRGTVQKFCNRWRGLLEAPERMRMGLVLGLMYPDILRCPPPPEMTVENNIGIVMRELEDVVKLFAEEQPLPKEEEEGASTSSRGENPVYCYGITSRFVLDDGKKVEILYTTEKEAVQVVKEEFGDMLKKTREEVVDPPCDGIVRQWTESDEPSSFQIRRFRVPPSSRRGEEEKRRVVYLAFEHEDWEFYPVLDVYDDEGAARSYVKQIAHENALHGDPPRRERGSGGWRVGDVVYEVEERNVYSTWPRDELDEDVLTPATTPGCSSGNNNDGEEDILPPSYEEWRCPRCNGKPMCVWGDFNVRWDGYSLTCSKKHDFHWCPEQKKVINLQAQYNCACGGVTERRAFGKKHKLFKLRSTPSRRKGKRKSRTTPSGGLKRKKST